MYSGIRTLFAALFLLCAIGYGQVAAAADGAMSVDQVKAQFVGKTVTFLNPENRQASWDIRNDGTAYRKKIPKAGNWTFDAEGRLCINWRQSQKKADENVCAFFVRTGAGALGITMRKRAVDGPDIGTIVSAK